MATDYDLDDDYGEPGYDDEPDDDDRYDEYKDDLATGYIHEDGSYREPDEPDWGSYRNYEPGRFWRFRYRARRIRDDPWRWRLRDRIKTRLRRLAARPDPDDWSDEPPF